jgi:hypothetical protein
LIYERTYTYVHQSHFSYLPLLLTSLLYFGSFNCIINRF